ncbi:hypothetical protein [Shigella flexneri]|uniref:hypothetical protein n=1 Tax=Shigella flexneri TaxID=623 RepID=UPI00020C94E2|nr:hypothetical protein [Shigella flexneri]EFW3773128.1 hypothetical protein [Shigella sonnei]EGJ88494.1 hypothetical protein SF274771_2036 [Shigella flexneri 2747-71]EGU0003934.1 hypothetical protein [Escherichia coli]EFP7076409.1 hypothetical protein [Shigella flexneri]EFP8223436.1 hypothetical protein [Shigella flexneri]
MNTELPVTNRQFLIILLTNAESSVDCCRYNLDLLKLSRWYAQAEDWDYEKIREMYAEPIQSYLQTHTEEELKRGLQDIFYFNNPYTCEGDSEEMDWIASRSDADLKHISNAMMQVESKWSRRLQVLTEDYENGTFDKLVPPDAERLQAKADQEQRFKSFDEALAGGASYDF